jgi:hypothetical protein
MVSSQLKDKRYSVLRGEGLCVELGDGWDSGWEMGPACFVSSCRATKIVVSI